MFTKDRPESALLSSESSQRAAPARTRQLAVLLTLVATLSLMGAVVRAEAPEVVDAITPQRVALDVGLAGEAPASVARYLLARGAASAQLSPDGSTIAFRYDVTGTRQLWLVDASGGVPRQLTFGNGVTFFTWAPDGKQLLYGADNDGDERPAYYLISADGKRERLLLPATDQGFRSWGGFSSDGRHIYYASTERNGLDFDIYRANVDSGAVERLFEGRYGFFVDAPSPDGRYAIVVESVGEDADNLYLLDLGSGDLHAVSVPGQAQISDRADHSGGGFWWRADSSGFYFASSAGQEFAAVYYLPLAAALADAPTRSDWTPIASAGHDLHEMRLCANDRYLLWLHNEDGFSRLGGRDLRRNRPLQFPLLPDGVYGIDCARDAPRALVRVTNWETPGDIYALDLRRRTAQRVFASQLAGLEPSNFVRPESIRIRARDDVELQGLLYLPRDAAAGANLPVLFFVHGGPTGQARPTYSGVIQYHVAQGAAVFRPNVRGSTGFGRTYTQLDDREARLDSVRDLIDMLDHFEADDRIDAQRAAVLGGSYGGYAVNAVLAAYPGRFRAGVSLFGVADWVTALEVASPALKASDRIEYGDISEPRWRAFYTKQSPVRQADQIRVPVLYSHGARDPRIDIAETETMVRTLRANGVPAPYIRFDDEGHGWRKLANRVFYTTREVAFLREYLYRIQDAGIQVQTESDGP
ncbi:MAG: S9 family peptidase [Pseudomonadota bacterium]